MKLKQLLTVVVCALGLLAVQNVHAQSLTYLSNTNQPIAGSNTIFPLLGVQFQTGPNPGGYTFNDVQLSMGNATGNPTGSLSVDLFFQAPIFGSDTLSGNTNPVTAGIYPYVATSNIVLLPNATYFIQAQIGGSFPNGYQWNYTGTTNATSLDGWAITGNQHNVHEFFTPYPMLAIDATPIESVLPILTITASGTNVLISWPVAAGNFALQSAPDLGGANWTAVPNAPATIDTNFVATNGISGSAQFFRLQSD
ncbi:MAG TPA: choice-of-anchor R domain-containing protein [Verrucomicrobiae bacterium]